MKNNFKIKRATRKLVWEQETNMLFTWDTPIIDAATSMYQKLTQASNQQMNIVFGPKGGGKTSFLNFMSLNGYETLDFDPFRTLTTAINNGDGNSLLTIGEYSTTSNMRNLSLKEERLMTKVFFNLALRLDAVSSFVPKGMSFSKLSSDLSNIRIRAIVLRPDKELYTIYLYHRDHDPRVERNHTPNRILSPRELDSYVDDIVSYVSSEMDYSSRGPSTSGRRLFDDFAVIDHEYTNACWINAIHFINF